MNSHNMSRHGFFFSLVNAGVDNGVMYPVR